jgi:transglutaminase-like putative cysteine protease
MLIRVGYDIIFEHPAPTPIIAMLYLHPSRGPSIRRGDYLLVEPPVQVSEYSDVFGNRCGRLLAPAGPIRFWNDAVVEDNGQVDHQNPVAEQHEIHELPDAALTFLMPSRYCEVDRMVDIAWQLFGTVPKGWARVQAICDFVHDHIQFDYLQARKTRTAYEAYQERVGVCRDFTHLASPSAAASISRPGTAPGILATSGCRCRPTRISARGSKRIWGGAGTPSTRGTTRLASAGS